MKKTLRLLTIFAVAVFAACNTITQPQQSNPGDFNVDFTNTDGTPSFLDATNAVAHLNANSTYSVVARQTLTSGTAEIAINGIPVNSTVPYNVYSTQNANLIVQYHDPSNNRDYTGSITVGSCAVSITQTSPTFQGTFTARLINRSDPDSVRTVTSGSFNATIQ